jgi:hypothetical protein
LAERYAWAQTRDHFTGWLRYGLVFDGAYYARQRWALLTYGEIVLGGGVVLVVIGDEEPFGWPLLLLVYAASPCCASMFEATGASLDACSFCGMSLN